MSITITVPEVVFLIGVLTVAMTFLVAFIAVDDPSEPPFGCTLPVLFVIGLCIMLVGIGMMIGGGA